MGPGTPIKTVLPCPLLNSHRYTTWTITEARNNSERVLGLWKEWHEIDHLEKVVFTW